MVIAITYTSLNAAHHDDRAGEKIAPMQLSPRIAANWFRLQSRRPRSSLTNRPTACFKRAAALLRVSESVGWCWRTGRQLSVRPPRLWRWIKTTTDNGNGPRWPTMTTGRIFQRLPLIWSKYLLSYKSLATAQTTVWQLAGIGHLSKRIIVTMKIV